MDNEEEDKDQNYYALPPETEEAYDPVMPVSNKIVNDEGHYIQSDFGWLFINAQQLPSGDHIDDFERKIQNNRNNLVQVDNIITGRVTMAMIDENDTQNNSIGEKLNESVEQENSKQKFKDKGGIKEKAGISICACLTVTWLAVGYFLADHLIQICQYIGVAIATSGTWIEAVYDFLSGLNVFNFNVEEELYLAIVIACISIILSFSLIALLAFFDIVDVE